MGVTLLLFFILLIIFGAWCSDECLHQFKKIAFQQEEDEHRNMRYFVRTYQCTHCKKRVDVDTRFGDPYE